MKMSEAILIGMEQFPEQAREVFQDGPMSACAWGCANWALTGFTGDPYGKVPWNDAINHFRDEYGCSVGDANDHGLSREDIAGMLMAIGE